MWGVNSETMVLVGIALMFSFNALLHPFRWGDDVSDVNIE